MQRHDKQPDSVACCPGQHGVPDERLPRQRPAGDRSGQGEGGYYGNRRGSSGRRTGTRRMCRRRCFTTTSFTTTSVRRTSRRATRRPASCFLDAVSLPGARDMIYASPVGAAGRVYIPTRDGYIFVLKAGSEYELLRVNKLEDSFSASAVVIGRRPVPARRKVALLSARSDGIRQRRCPRIRKKIRKEEGRQACVIQHGLRRLCC